MIKLEETAEVMFMLYAQKKLAHNVDWKYLSKERKQAWVEEVHNAYTQCVVELKKELKPYVQSAGAASYERGFVAGQNHEHMRIQAVLDAVITSMDNQLKAVTEG
jgi:hypothetical protein